MFKVSKSVLPSYVNQMFSFLPFNEMLQSLRSTGALDFYTPKPHKKIFKQSLIYSGPVIWNNLTDCLKNLETVDSFHRHCINSTANIKALRGILGALSVNKLSHIPKLQPISAVYENQ